MKLSCAALMVCFVAAPSFGGEVPNETLEALGLGGMTRLTDAQAMRIRGSSSSATAAGGSFITGRLTYTNEFNTFSETLNFSLSFRFTDANAGLNAMSTANQFHFIDMTENLVVAPTALAPGFNGTITGVTGTSLHAAGGTSMATAQ